MSEIKIGVVTDSHMGGFDSRIAEALKREELDGIEYLGDAPSNMHAPPQKHFDDITATLKIYDKVGVPVSWIPGNYEDFVAYHAAFSQLEDKLDNVVDATRQGKYTLKLNGIEVDLVWVPGSTEDVSRGFHVRNDLGPTADYSKGKSHIHVYNPNDLRELVTRPDRTILLCHNPPQMSADNTFDVALRAIYRGNKIIGPIVGELVKAYRGEITPTGKVKELFDGRAQLVREHAGNPVLSGLVDELGIQKVLAGDIHDAVYTTDRQGRSIPPGTFSRELFGNPGPAKDGRYGVLVYRDDGMATLFSKSVKG
ncbi:MAG: hypothetical protein HY512_01250 [Candidatus Aenigmarchaeota archaeon]|nr:hypothetical protein [Candidatus Aenigmarchaeota archaeon]